MAIDRNALDTFQRVGGAETPDQAQIFQLTAHALELIKDNMQPNEVAGPLPSGDPGKMATEGLGHLLEEQLRLNYENARFRQEFSSVSGQAPDAGHKATPRLNSTTSEAADLSGLSGKRKGILASPSPLGRGTSHTSCGSADRQNDQITGPGDNVTPSIEPHITLDGGSAMIRESYSAHNSGDNSEELRLKSMIKEQTDQTKVSDVYRRIEARMADSSRSKRGSTPGRENARKRTSTSALARNPSKGDKEAKRTGRGIHPWPERGISPKDAIERFHKEALAQRKSFSV